MVLQKKLVTLVFLGKKTQTTEAMEIFKDNNNWNEKSIIGFVAFAIMCVIMIVDLITGWLGRDLMINEFVYDSFVLVVLGSFGISGLEKFAKK
jgi:formate-dependent nitrite reductase membrane component NrfD